MITQIMVLLEGGTWLSSVWKLLYLSACISKDYICCALAKASLHSVGYLSRTQSSPSVSAFQDALSHPMQV